MKSTRTWTIDEIDLGGIGTALFVWSAACVLMGAFIRDCTWVDAQKQWCAEQGAAYLLKEDTGKHLCAKAVSP